MEEMNLDQQKALAMMAMRQRAAASAGAGDGDKAVGAAPGDAPKRGGVLRNAAAGAVEGITGTGAMFSDPGAGEELRALGINPDVPLEGPEMRQHRLNEVSGKLGFNPEDVAANTTTERLTRAAGAGATSALFPGGAVGKIAEAGPAALRTAAEFAARTATGAAAGVGGEAAAEVAPNALKPLARLAGGAVAALPSAAVRSIPSAITAADRLLGVTKAAREMAVGERIANAASVPEAVKAALDATSGAEIIPGSKPTTFQLTGDMGLGALERDVQTKSPAEFQQRRADQNAARREQLDQLQPTGNAADLANYVKGRIRWLDQQTEQDVADATRVAQERASGLGGERTPEEYGTALRDPLEDRRAAAKTRERALWRAIDPAGDLTVNAGPVRLEAKSIMAGIAKSAKPASGDELHILQAASDYGTTIPFSELGALRTSVNDAMRAELRSSGQSQVYGRLSRMRSAIEQSINTAVEQRAQEDPDELYNGLTRFAQNLAGWERDGASSLEGLGAANAAGAGGVPPIRGAEGARGGGFSNSPADTGISAPSAVKQPPSLLQTIIRMGGIRTRGGDGNLTKEGQDIASLVRDARRPGLINNQEGLYPDQIRQELQNAGWFGRSERFGASARAAGEHPGDSLQELYDLMDRELRGQKVLHPEATTAAQRNDPAQYEQHLSERGAASGVQRLHGWSLRDWDDAIAEREAMRAESQTTFDQAARDRLNAASAATRERADTFDRGPVGQVLAKAGRQDQYKLPDAAVGLKIFQPGPRGAENITAYRRAVGDDAALVNLQDYIASSLRRTASNADGTLDHGKVGKWLARYSDAMRAFPELQARFRNAQASSAALEEAASSRRAILDAAQSGALGKLAGLDTPEDVTRTVGGIFGAKDSVAQMRDLARTASRDPNAREGLRKAVADFMQQKLIGNTEAGTSGEAAIKSDTFQSFVRNNRATLSEVFSADEVGSLEAIAADLQRANRSLNAVRIPGQSNTAQDLSSKATGQPSVLRALVSDIASASAAAAGAVVHGFSGAVTAVLGAKAIAALRDKGVRETNEILKDAMLNPEFARTLLMKVRSGPTFQRLLAMRIQNALQSGAVGGALSGATATSKD